MFKSIDKWLAGYLVSSVRRPAAVCRPRHLLVALADHYEPFREASSAVDARRLVQSWCDAYRRSFSGLRDSTGRAPRHTFFYPGEEYDPECLEILRNLCAEAYGEVEIQLHHRNDTPDTLRHQLESFRDRLADRHGLLGRDADGNPRYGFVHGNWALCNSRPDGDWCGVNEELAVLRESGCYADFTFPSAPSPTQPRQVNSIYYARDADARSRGHDRGLPVQRGGNGTARAGHLMLIQGPLALNWKWRKYGVLPRLENAEITGANPLTGQRIDLGVRQSIRVVGRDEWTILKLHTHGCLENTMSTIVGRSMRKSHEYLQGHYNDGEDWRLHYVSARELYNVIRAAEDGNGGNPADFLNYEIKPPDCG